MTQSSEAMREKLRMFAWKKIMEEEGVHPGGQDPNRGPVPDHHEDQEALPHIHLWEEIDRTVVPDLVQQKDRSRDLVRPTGHDPGHNGRDTASDRIKEQAKVMTRKLLILSQYFMLDIFDIPPSSRPVLIQ